MASEFERQLHGLKHGDHVCPIHESAAEQTAVVVPFITQGLLRGERCLYLAGDQMIQDGIQEFTLGNVDVQRALERGALQFLNDRGVYLRKGEFDPRAMIEFVSQAEAAALADGFAGLRLLGNMTWVLGAKLDGDWLIEYEALLNDFLANSRSVILCHYDRSRFGPALILEVLRTHPVAILGEQVCPNLFYEPPQMILGKVSVGEQVDWKIAQLKRAREADKTSQEYHALLRAVAEGISDALFVKDRGGRYLMINSAGARFLGKSVDDVLGKDDTELFTPETAHPIMESDRRIIASGKTETFEQAGTAAGVTRTYLTTRGPYWDQLGNIVGIIGIARDITDSKKLQVERDRLVERLRLQIDRLPLAYILMDASHRVLDWNPAAEKTFGYSKEEALGRSCPELILPGLIDDRLQDVIRRIETGDMDAHSVNDNQTKDGRIITCEWFNTPLMDADGKLAEVIALAQDITERKQADEALREYARRLQTLSRRVVEVQEEERRHVARELHDEIGQVLSAVSVNLQAVKGVCDAATQPRLEDSIHIVDQAVQQVRSLSLDLRPSMLDDLGLVSTLRWYADRRAQRAGFALHFVAQTATTRLPPYLATACYRVVQEALTNVVRHARARHVWLEFHEREEDVQIVIRDDGVGFDVATVRQRAARGASFGVLGMQERVELLGGHFEIESKPAQGTTIRVRFPESSAQVDRAE